jgi:hypothetical protein
MRRKPEWQSIFELSDGFFEHFNLSWYKTRKTTPVKVKEDSSHQSSELGLTWNKAMMGLSWLEGRLWWIPMDRHLPSYLGCYVVEALNSTVELFSMDPALHDLSCLRNTKLIWRISSNTQYIASFVTKPILFYYIYCFMYYVKVSIHR